MQDLSIKNDERKEIDSEESEPSESNNISFDSDINCNMNEQPEDSNEVDEYEDEEDDFIRRIYDKCQDDRKIVKMAALNDMYKLVERPKWLL